MKKLLAAGMILLVIGLYFVVGTWHMSLTIIKDVTEVASFVMPGHMRSPGH